MLGSGGMIWKDGKFHRVELHTHTTFTNLPLNKHTQEQLLVIDFNLKIGKTTDREKLVFNIAEDFIK